MDATYLRVKNWASFQHYDPLKRRPPWIKFYNDVLGDNDDFMRLNESEQWQLVRIWIVASRSSSLTRDEDGVAVPVVANDAQSLQRSIMSVHKVPLAKLIREGWLIPVEEDELIPGGTSSASSRASNKRTKRESAVAAERKNGAKRSRGLEVDPKAVRAREPDVAAADVCGQPQVITFPIPDLREMPAA